MAAGHPLIDVPSLARALGLAPAAPGPGAGADPRARPAVLDVRWRLGGPPGIVSYREGHVPGAIFLDLDRELCGAPGDGGRHPLPAAAAFQDVMRRAGVSAGRPVVVYDDADSTAAARAWWTLRYFGHDEVRVLDGGFRAWTAAGEPVEAGEPGGPAGPPGDFSARPGGMPLLDAAAAGRLARSGVLLDARAAQRFRGEVEPADPVAGHIPGAVSAPAAGNVGTDGVFRRPDELRARFAALGASPRDAGPAPGGGGPPPGDAPGDADPVPGETGGPVGVYCGSGILAAQEVLALAVADIPAALYVGSWSHWVTDPGRPVATGSLPG